MASEILAFVFGFVIVQVTLRFIVAVMFWRQAKANGLDINFKEAFVEFLTE
jgi:hypothetical protein